MFRVTVDCIAEVPSKARDGSFGGLDLRRMTTEIPISHSRGAREVDRANLSLEAARYAASYTSTA